MTKEDYNAAIETLVAVYGSDAEVFVSVIETARDEETVHLTDNEAHSCADDCMGCFTERLADGITRTVNGGEADQQAVRLKAAEDLCVMYSWSAAHAETNREKAAHELWRRWYGIVGSDFLTADAHPDLSDAMVDLLAAQRDETRARTLARIRSDAPTELPGGED